MIHINIAAEPAAHSTAEIGSALLQKKHRMPPHHTCADPRILMNRHFRTSATYPHAFSLVLSPIPDRFASPLSLHNGAIGPDASTKRACFSQPRRGIYEIDELTVKRRHVGANSLRATSGTLTKRGGRPERFTNTNNRATNVFRAGRTSTSKVRFSVLPATADHQKANKNYTSSAC